MALTGVPEGYVRLEAQFVIQDGPDVKVVGLQAPVDPHVFENHLVEACHRMGRNILKGAVAETNMLAHLTTHPEDQETLT